MERISAQWFFFFQACHGINVPRIPKHPTMGAKPISRFDLGHDFLIMEGSSVKSVISERLQPRSETMGRKTGSFLGSFEGKINDFIRGCNRVSVAGYSVLKPGWV